MKRSARLGLAPTIAMSMLITSTSTSTGAAQASDPDTTANDVAQAIAVVAPDAVAAAPSEVDRGFTHSWNDTTVTIPREATDPVSLTTADPATPDLTVNLPDLDGPEVARQAEDGTIVYTTDDDASLAVQTLADGSTRFLSVLDSPAAPESYDYRFGGTQLELQDDGSVLVHADGEIVGAIAAPWATDATGTPVPTHYETTGETLTQIVQHTTGQYTYPITADPTYSMGVGYYAHFNRAETKTISQAGWSVTVGATACGLLGTMVLPGVGTAAGAAACALKAGEILYQAGVAQNSSPKRCLYLRAIPIGTIMVVYPGTYRDSRCK